MSVVPVVVASCLLLHARMPQEAVPTVGGEKVVFVSGAAGGTVELPCCLDPRATGDRPKLILWYRAGTSTPIFSHDDRAARDQAPTGRYELQDDRSVHVTPVSATLTIYRLDAEDAGLYECRVDFYSSPTLTAMYNLSILLPPSVLEVEGWGQRAVVVEGGETGAKNAEAVAGPYEEGQKLHLSCTARGGSPRPNVTWWRDGTLVDRGWEVKGPGMVCNDLVVPHLDRKWFRTKLTCKASTTPELKPLSVELDVDMKLKPLSVTVAPPPPAPAGEVVTLRCLVHGARPAAVISWYRGRDQLNQVGKSDSWPSSDGALPTYTSESVLLLNLTTADDGAAVTCAATNPHLTAEHVVRSTAHLSVLYRPIVEAELGRSLDPDHLTAGEDVYFTCLVRANPAAGPVTWYREGELQRPGAEVVLSGSDLVLQKVSRHRAGRYWCTASNSIGSTDSAAVMLRLNYVPECRSSHATFFIYDQPINITCQVEASPPVQDFVWRWNFSSDGFSVRQLDEAEEETRSHSSPPLPRKLLLWERSSNNLHIINKRSSQAPRTNDPKHSSREQPPLKVYQGRLGIIKEKLLPTFYTKGKFSVYGASHEKFNSSSQADGKRKRHVHASGTHQWSVVEVSAQPGGEAVAKELFCFGVNEIGRQVQPCKFLVKIARSPPPVSSCRLLNITSSSLSVTCEKPLSSSSGPSLYRAEVYLESGELLANVTSSWPSFRVNELDPATTYSIKVYVSTGPSTSMPILVSALTSSTSPTYAVEETGPEPPPPPASVSSATGLHLLGWSAGGAVVVAVVSQVYCRGRKKRCWPHSAGDRTSISSGGAGAVGEPSAETSTPEGRRTREGSFPSDEDGGGASAALHTTIQETPLSSPQVFHELSNQAELHVDLTKHGTKTKKSSRMPKKGEISSDNFDSGNEDIIARQKSSDRIKHLLQDFKAAADGRSAAAMPTLPAEVSSAAHRKSDRPTGDEFYSKGTLAIKEAAGGTKKECVKEVGNILHEEKCDEDGEKTLLVDAMLLMASEESTL